MKSKLSWLVSLFTIATLLLAACGGGQTTPVPAEGGEQPVASGEKAKVTIFVGFGTGTDPDQVEAQIALGEIIPERNWVAGERLDHHDAVPDKVRNQQAQ